MSVERVRPRKSVVDSPITTFDGVRAWLREQAEADTSRTEIIPFDGLRGWDFAPGSGNLVHESGRFFAVEGLRVRAPNAAVPEWEQPILNQPEIGILGVLAREVDGVPHFLMQAKTEPGNAHGVQLSPTVQATRSNYLRVHRGRAVPYLEYFRRPERHRVLADVRQSEQGARFLGKRNRNMIVAVGPDEDVPVRPGFCWFTLGQLHALLAEEDVLNMDTRSVLACLPPQRPGPAEFSVHPTADVLSWLTGLRTERQVVCERIPLRGTANWHRSADSIAHDSGGFFSVVAVDVHAGGREVAAWTQPMMRPHSRGVAAFLLGYADAVPHVLVQARSEPGFTDVVELAPTVQCAPRDYARLPAAATPPFLPEVLAAPPARIRFDTVLSEEGGRFYHALNRYLIVETELGASRELPGYRWLAVPQLLDLIRHSHYLNVEARTLLACLRSVVGW